MQIESIDTSARVIRARLSPFGLEVLVRAPASALTALPSAWLRGWVRDHRVLVLRGFSPIDRDALVALARALGASRSDVRASDDDADLCAASGHAVQIDREIFFHSDGSEAVRPRYLVFHCDEAPPPGSGGEAIFCDPARARGRLYDPEACYVHAWREGDVLLADNHALFHGRAAFAQEARRRVRRVNVT